MTVWWETRREGEPTATYLGRVLAELGLPEMAVRASLFHYDDYFCPPDVDDGMNIHRLIADLQASITRTTSSPQRKRIAVVIEAAKDGAFDGTAEEADAWSASPDGQATFAQLMDEK